MEQLEVQASSLRYLTEAPPLLPPPHADDSAVLPPLAFPGIAAGASTAGVSAASTPSMFGGPASPGVPAQATPNQQRRNTARTTTTTSMGASQSPSASGSGAAKRRANDEDESSAAKQQRSKRNRYISIACNECKRRKIKCNGETPCKRCGNLNLACLYTPNCCSGGSFKDSDEYKQMASKMQRLEDLVASLSQSVAALRQETQRLAPLQERLLPPAPTTTTHRPDTTAPHPLPRHPIFRGGPTSTAFTVNVAKNTLHNMGYDNDMIGAAQDVDPVLAAMDGTSSHASPLEPPRLPSMGGGWSQEHREHPHAEPQTQAQAQARPPPPPPPPLPPLPRDPLWELDRDEMLRLCRVHENEVGIMYPVVSIARVIEHVHRLAAWRAGHCLASNHRSRDDGIDMSDLPTLLVKIVLCCALAVEEHGHSERATRLYDSMQPVIDRKLMSEPSDVRYLSFLALTAGYRFLTNDEVLAWRVMGQVVRLCLEQGLHRREGVAVIADPQERQSAVNTFWTAYILDRRWSFGTGLPYVVQDDKIDPHLPQPDSPYSVAMITYSRLSAKIWRLVDFFEPAVVRDDLQREAFEELDREVLQWYASCPAQVQISDLCRQPPDVRSYDMQRQQIWTRLRLNQMRIWLLTPVLHSASSINKNRDLAQKVVDLAKETIHYLSDLYTGSDLYARIQVFYHQFLTSAIAVLFLASTHQPVQFSTLCRDEFYMALDLVKDMSAKSWVSQRLWRTIRSLKSYAPRLGLQQEQQGQGQGQSHSGRASVAGSSSHHHDGTVLPPPPPPPPMPSGPYYPPSSSLSLSGSPVGTGTAAVTMPTPTSVPPQYSQLGGSPEKPNGVQLQNEMSLIFEGLLGLNNNGASRLGSSDDDSGSGCGSGRYPEPMTSSSSPAVENGERFGQDGDAWGDTTREADSPSMFERVKNLF